MGNDVRELGTEEEIFEDREMILDVLRRRNLRGNEVPDYYDPGYIPDH